MVMILIKTLMVVLCVLLGVAFYTLLERKVLSYIQNRKGPNKVGIMGLLQPFSDGLKLFVKELIVPNKSNFSLYILIPILGFSVSLALWILLPSTYTTKFISMSLMLFICITSLNVYVVLGSGWSSNSVYAFLGGLRASAQAISYEISLILILLFPFLIIQVMSMSLMIWSFPVVFISMISTYLWFTTILAETNRAPFDFAEGESELVSGFNIEYSGGMFALLFLGEYSVILFMCIVTSAIYFSLGGYIYLYISVGIALAMLFLITRGVYPRHRYDKLMSLCWKSFLPLSISFLFIINMFLFYNMCTS